MDKLKVRDIHKESNDGLDMTKFFVMKVLKGSHYIFIVHQIMLYLNYCVKNLFKIIDNYSNFDISKNVVLDYEENKLNTLSNYLHKQSRVLINKTTID